VAYSALIVGPYHDPIWPPTASIRPRGGRQCPLYVRNTVSCIASGNIGGQGHVCINSDCIYVVQQCIVPISSSDFKEIVFPNSFIDSKLIKKAIKLKKFKHQWSRKF